MIKALDAIQSNDVFEIPGSDGIRASNRCQSDMLAIFQPASADYTGFYLFMRQIVRRCRDKNIFHSGFGIERKTFRTVAGADPISCSSNSLESNTAWPLLKQSITLRESSAQPSTTSKQPPKTEVSRYKRHLRFMRRSRKVKIACELYVDAQQFTTSKPSLEMIFQTIKAIHSG